MEEIKQNEVNILHDLAERLRGENENLDDLVYAIRDSINSHANALPERYYPKSIIESRFTSAQEAFNRGIKKVVVQ